MGYSRKEDEGFEFAPEAEKLSADVEELVG
jgi:hypothetical protein